MKYQDTQWLKNAIASPYTALIAITLLGAVLRFHQLGKESLWVDEAATWRFAQMPFSQLWGEGAVRETNPPLYYTLQRLWLIFGESEAALRSLSAVIGTITIPLIYGLGRTLGGHSLGLVASALLATSSINIQYSQEARAYNLLTAAATLAIWGLAYLLTNPHQATTLITQGLFRRHSHKTNPASDLAWLAYICGVTIALYCHNTAVLLLAVANTVAFGWWITTGRWNQTFFVNWFVANIIPLLIWSWWVPKILQQAVVTLSDFWISTPTVITLIGALANLYTHKYDLPIVLGLAGLGIWYWRHQPIKIALTLILSVGTVLLGFLISFWRPIFITRIFLWTTVPFIILIAVGLLNFRKKSLIAISVTLLMIIQFIAVGNYYQNYSKKEPWNQVGQYVEERLKPNDVVVLFPPIIDAAFQYYFQPSQPITQYGLKRWIYNIPRLPHTRVTEIPRSRLLDLTQKFSRIWLVVKSRNFEDRQNLVISELNKNMTNLGERRFGFVEVFLFERKK